MKFMILLLMFFSISAQANFSCKVLFELPKDTPLHFDSFMKAPMPIELKVREEVGTLELVQVNKDSSLSINLDKFPQNSAVKGDVKEVELRLLEALAASKTLRGYLQKIRSLSDDIGLIRTSTENFSQEKSNRFFVVNAMTLLAAAELLTAKGVQYTPTQRQLIISLEGDHYINQLAKRAYQKNHLRITFDPALLMEHGALGMYYHHKEIFALMLSPELILKPSFFQDGTALHEYTHHIDFGEKRNEVDRPYHARLNIQADMNAPKRTSYKKGFSVDEIKTHRANVKLSIHNAITAKTDFDFHRAYEEAEFFVSRQIDLSKTTKKVFGRLLITEDRVVSKKGIEIEIEALGKFIIDQSSQHNERSTYVMAKFTLDLYTAFDAKFKEYEMKSASEKRALLHKMNRVITQPEVRRLNGNYPTLESINKTLEE